jgi:hypothetical protein
LFTEKMELLPDFRPTVCKENSGVMVDPAYCK